MIDKAIRLERELKRSGIFKKDLSKVSEDEVLDKLFPKIERGPEAYTANLIDLMDRIRSTSPGAEGKQFVLPKYTDVPTKKMKHFKTPTITELLRMFNDNFARGGTSDFEEFKTNIFNREYDDLKIDLTDYLDFYFDGEEMSIKEAHEFGNKKYEDLDQRGSFFKTIEERTKHNLGLGALFQEEMNDRRAGL